MSQVAHREGPDGLTIRILGPGDGPVLANVHPDVFDGPLDDDLTAEFLADPRHHIAVALHDGQVVGMATGVHHLHPDKRNQLWIDEIGVAEPYRRCGIGRGLLDALLEHGRSLGCAEAWVVTEPDNVAARGLYAVAGGAEQPSTYVVFDLATKPRP